MQNAKAAAQRLASMFLMVMALLLLVIERPAWGRVDRAANSIFGGSAGQFPSLRASDHWPGHVTAED
jgi:hypothetical protein